MILHLPITNVYQVRIVVFGGEKLDNRTADGFQLFQLSSRVFPFLTATDQPEH